MLGRLLCIAVFFLSACGATAESGVDRPRLVSEVTLGPSTPTLARTALATPIALTQEVFSPLENVTVDADFVLVTPTLPPSKTPTATPTFTQTPTLTLTPTITTTATATSFLLPTSEIVPLTQPVAAPVNQVCDSVWFFLEPRPESCPLNPPNASQGVYQTFQRGYMIWVGSQDAVYVIFSDGVQPGWLVLRDYFDESRPEMAYLNDPPIEEGVGLWQPRRGFGLIWRDNANVRDRLGAATMPWEQPYSVQIQTSRDGSIFLSQPTNVVFSLLPDGRNWSQFTTNGTFPSIPGAGPATPPPGGLVPLPTAPGG